MVTSVNLTAKGNSAKLLADVLAEIKVVEGKVRSLKVKVDPNFSGFIGEVNSQLRLLNKRFELNVDVVPNFTGFKAKYNTARKAYEARTKDLVLDVKINPVLTGVQSKLKAERLKYPNLDLKVPVEFDIKETQLLAKLKTVEKSINAQGGITINVGTDVKTGRGLVSLAAQNAALGKTSGLLRTVERSSEGAATALATVAASTSSNIAQNRILTGVLQKYLGVTAAAVPASIAFANALTAGALAFKGLGDAAEFERISVGIRNIIEAQNSLRESSGLSAGIGADKFLGDLKKFAAVTPFEFKDLTELSSRLLGVGFQAKDTIEVMNTLGNVVSVTGGDTTNIQGVVKAIGQIRGAGKLYAQDLNQINQQLPGFNPYQQIGKSIDQTETQLRKLMSVGKGPSGQQAIDALLKGMKEFPGAADAMAKQSRTLVGTFSNLKDSIFNVTSTEFAPALAPARSFLNSIRLQVDEYLPKIAGKLSESIAIFADEAVLGRIAKVWAGNFNKFLDVVNDFTSKSKNEFVDFFEGVLVFGEQFFKLFGAVGPEIADLAASVARLSVPLSEAFGTAASASLKVYVNLLVALTPLINTFADVLESIPAPLLSIGLGLVLATKYTSQFASTLKLLQIPRLIKLFDGLRSGVSKASAQMKVYADTTGTTAVRVKQASDATRVYETVSNKSIARSRGFNNILGKTALGFGLVAKETEDALRGVNKVADSSSKAAVGLDKTTVAAKAAAGSSKTAGVAVGGLGSALASLGIAAALSVGIGALTEVITRMKAPAKAAKEEALAFKDAIKKVAEQSKDLGSAFTSTQFFDAFADSLVSADSRMGKILEDMAFRAGKGVGEVVSALTEGTGADQSSFLTQELNRLDAEATKLLAKGRAGQQYISPGGDRSGRVSGEELEAFRELTKDQSLGDNFWDKDYESVTALEKALKKTKKELTDTLQLMSREAVATQINTSFDEYAKVINAGTAGTAKYSIAQEKLREIKKKVRAGTLDESEALAKQSDIMSKLEVSTAASTSTIQDFIFQNGLVGKSSEVVKDAMAAAGVKVTDFGVAFEDASNKAIESTAKLRGVYQDVFLQADDKNFTSFDLPQSLKDAAFKAGQGDEQAIEDALNQTQVLAGKLGVSTDTISAAAAKYAEESVTWKKQFYEGSLQVKDMFSFTADAFRDSQVSLDTMISNSKEMKKKNDIWLDNLVAIAKFGGGKYRDVVTTLLQEGIGTTFDASGSIAQMLNNKQEGKLAEWQSIIQSGYVDPARAQALVDAGIVSADESLGILEGGQAKIKTKIDAAFLKDLFGSGVAAVGSAIGDKVGGKPGEFIKGITAYEGGEKEGGFSEKAAQLIKQVTTPLKQAAESGEVDKVAEESGAKMAASVKTGLDKGFASGDTSISAEMSARLNLATSFDGASLIVSSLVFGMQVGANLKNGVLIGLSPLQTNVSDSLSLTLSLIQLVYGFKFQDTGRALGEALTRGIETGMSRIGAVVGSALSKARPPITGFASAVNSISSAVGSSSNIKVPAFHSGGAVSSPTQSANLLAPKRGEVPAMLKSNEYVVSDKGTKAFSKAELDAINKGNRSLFENLTNKKRQGDGDAISLESMSKNFEKIVNYNFGDYFKKIETAKNDMSNIDDLGDMFPKYGEKLHASTKAFGEKVQGQVDPGFGFISGAVGDLAVGGAGWRALASLIAGSGIRHRISSTTRPGAITVSGNRSYHSAGRAVDLVGDMKGIFNFFLQYAGSLKELFYSFANVYVKNGKVLPIGSLSRSIYNTHKDHVHVAAANGANLTRPTNLLAGEAGVESVIPWTRPARAIEILKEATRRGWTSDVVSNLMGSDTQSSSGNVSGEVVGLLTSINDRVANLEGRSVEINVEGASNDSENIAKLLARKLERAL